MKSIFQFIKVKIGLLGAIIIAAIVGGITSAAVLAAIPDSNGVIHGCIKPSNGSLTIIDSEAGQTCTAGQNSLSWDQSGWKGYGYIKADGTLDTSRSKNVSSITYNPDQSVYCVKTAFLPTLISVTGRSATSSGMVRGADNESDGQIDNDCGTTADAEVSASGIDGQIYFFFR